MLDDLVVIDYEGSSQTDSTVVKNSVFSRDLFVDIGN